MITILQKAQRGRQSICRAGVRRSWMIPIRDRYALEKNGSEEHAKQDLVKAELIKIGRMLQNLFHQPLSGFCNIPFHGTSHAAGKSKQVPFPQDRYNH